MFGSFTLLIAIVGLATLSAGSLAYAMLYGRIAKENAAEGRLDAIRNRTSVESKSSRANVDTGRRRQSVQDTLKELEEKQKSRSKQNKSPSLKVRMEQAGLSWSRRTFLLISATCGVVVFLVTWALSIHPLAAAGFAIAGLLGLPRWIVNYLRKRRMKKFLEEFANAVDVIVRGVKAGLPLNDCIKIIANEAAEPVRGEFRTISESQALGLSLSDAVTKLPERMPLPEASFFAIVVSIQQRAGGNLAEALGNLSRVLRERRKMEGKIGAMSMEAKASAAIIGALPVIVMVLVYITSPEYIMLLFTEQLGNVILGSAAAWMLIGILVMRKMIHFDY